MHKHLFDMVARWVRRGRPVKVHPNHDTIDVVVAQLHTITHLAMAQAWPDLTPPIDSEAANAKISSTHKDLLDTDPDGFIATLSSVAVSLLLAEATEHVDHDPDRCDLGGLTPLEVADCLLSLLSDRIHGGAEMAHVDAEISHTLAQDGIEFPHG